MKQLLILTVLFSLVACTAHRTANVKLVADKDSIIIYPTSNIVDGRQTFSVVINDSTGMDYMYAEEIAKALKTGVWEYDEDLRVE